jgi:hypothetical protein
MAIVIDITPLQNLGNRMIQFLAAWKLQQEVGGMEIRNPNLPEWGLLGREIDRDPNTATLEVELHHPIPFPTLCDLARSGKYGHIVIGNYMQRMECLPDRVTSGSLFSAEDHSYDPKDNELLINVRSGELTLGVPHYPLVPGEFYERIIEISGLEPVFMGQIGENAYCEKLKALFPRAKFLPSQGAIQDFQTVRKAKHIVISVSTFSWLAAWLSEAKQIYLPMLGFLNPMHFIDGRKNIDLLPTDDNRYRFFLFPLHFGIPEHQALPYQPALTEFCQEISARQVNFLRTQTPLLKVRTPTMDFDGIWYSHEYMQAAAEISEGWFAGPLEHYIEIGMRRGYQPLPSRFSVLTSSINKTLTDLSLHKRATQSSLSRYSFGATVEEDAGRAVSGEPRTPYAFHTGYEANPWWSVDLEEVCLLHQIVVLNRCEDLWVAGRATPLVASTSLDGKEWSHLFTVPDGLIPGRNGRPLIWTAPEPVSARFFRFSVARSTCLHLQQVRVLGLRRN